MNKIYFSFLLLLLFSISLVAQTPQVRGIVIDESGIPLIGASVVYQGTEFGVTTDIEGKFIIAQRSESILEISFLGFETQLIDVQGTEFLKVTLKEKKVMLSPSTIYAEKYSKNHNYTELKKIDIQQTPRLSPQNLYNKVPGLFMHSGAPNTNRLTIRGIGSRSPFSTTKIRAYLNDVPLTNGIGESNLEDLNLPILDQIIVTKGPSSPEYGSSLGGVLHYKTLKSKREETSLTGQFSYGSFGTIGGNVNYNYKHKGAVFSINQDILQSDGYRDNNQYDRNTLSGFAQVTFGSDIFTVFVNTSRLKAQIPSALNITDFTESPSSAAGNWKAVEGEEDYRKNQVSITHQREINDIWLTSVTGFLTTFENDERRPFNTLSQNNNAIGARAIVTRGLSGGGSNFKIGTEIFQEREYWSTYQTIITERGNLLSDNFEKRNFLNIFAQARYAYGNWKLDGGLNANITNYDYEDRFILDGNQSGVYSFAPIISPYLSIAHNKGGNNLFYLTFSHGFSAPTLEETLTPDGLINPEIQPETAFNLELGTRKAYKGYEFDLSVYSMWARNLLVAERISEDQTIGVNAGRTWHPGVELSIQKQWKIKTSWIDNLEAFVSYNYAPHQFTEFLNNDTDFSGKRLPGNPSQKLAAYMQLNMKQAHLRLNHISVDKMYADDANEIEVQAYSVSDLSLSWDIFTKAKSSFQIFGSLNNIFNASYASMIAVNPRSFGGFPPRYLYPGLPRNFSIGVRLGYK